MECVNTNKTYRKQNNGWTFGKFWLDTGHPMQMSWRIPPSSLLHRTEQQQACSWLVTAVGLHEQHRRTSASSPVICLQHKYVSTPKLSQLTVPGSACQWNTSFLTNRRQQFRQNCWFSALLYSLSMNNYTSRDLSVKPLKAADDTSYLPYLRCRRVCIQTGVWTAGALVQLNC